MTPLNAASLEPLLRKKFGSVKRSRGKNGLEYIVDCCFCSKRMKLYINPDRGLYICFRCGETGRIEDLIGKMRYTRPETQAVEVPLPEDVEPPGTLLPLTALERDHPAICYLSERGFDPVELNNYFGVRYCSAGRKFAELFDTTNTLVFPIWMGGKLRGWQARLLYNPDKLTDEECAAYNLPQDEDGDWVRPPKYWTNPGLRKGAVLFNDDWARKGNLVVVCEGAFDAIAVGRCAVATLGKGISDEQMRRLRFYWDAIVPLLDPDAAEEQMRLAMQLQMNTVLIPVQLKGYKDAGEAPRYEIWKQIVEAAARRNVNLGDYRFVV